MALSLTALHQPLADFFVERFGTPGAEEVVFRFDRFGSVLTEDDFVHPDDPEGAATAAIALEKVSDLANRVPRDAGDGVNVVLTGDSIDSFYHDRMLLPAQPHLPAQADPETRRAVLEQFDATKAAALQTWQDSEMASVSGSPLPFRATDASPTTWYDPGSEGWAQSSFTVKEPSTERAATPVAWRAIPSEAVLRSSLTRAAVPLAQVRTGPFTVSAAPGRSTARPERVVARETRVRDGRTGRGTGDAARARVRDHRSDPVVQVLSRRLVTLDAVRRIRVKEAVEQSTAATPTTTDRVQLSFEYCVVRLRRRWWSSTFVSGGGWRAPGQARGALTDPGTPGHLDLLPVAFVAVRNLTISATWSAGDREQLRNAMSWGPFAVSASAGTSDVKQPGMQVVGWLMQRLPALPPHPWVEPADDADDAGTGDEATDEADGAPTPAPGTGSRTYTVRPGDTLFTIAAEVYGDGSRYRVLASANGIADPDQISVGQRLAVPPG